MTEYIKEKIENRKKAIDEVIEEKIGNQFIGLFSSVALVIIGLSVVALSPTVGLIVASVSASAIPLKIRNCKNLYTRKARIREEIKHLEELKEDGIENNDSIRREKSVELNTLDRSKKAANDKYTTSKRITLLSYGLTVAGIGAIVINPVYAVAVIPGLIANSLAARNETKKYKSCEEIKRKINNIHHDIDVLNIQNGNVSTCEEICLENQKSWGATLNDLKKSYKESNGYTYNDKTVFKSDEDINTLSDYFEESYYQEEKPKEYTKGKIGK